MFNKKGEDFHKHQSNTQELFKIDEDQLMNTKRSNQKNTEMMNINNVKHLESIGDGFVELPRMTSLEGQMNQAEHHGGFSPPNDNSHSSHPGNNKTKTNS